MFSLEAPGKNLFSVPFLVSGVTRGTCLRDASLESLFLSSQG